ncbi:heat shock protein DnaJ domain protein [Sphingobium chlorophenolicum L-1]|uniref:Heat shock protein DnaJ domain protein n=1 Tax=Sphingobium chlorophenolicum L-1 TaxID=690566 RepID=F6EWU2_SPHCR|nr:DnaJ domain-containing protein [Sphingobium chlorophenolicum]AEG49880.1 heat shock protein DnaJ domain protein [Sphingobium chlorophenolicum L-1]
MGLLALLLIGLAAWLIWTGRLQRMSAKDGMALGAALVGAVMAAKGKPLIGAPLLIGATLFFFSRSRGGKARAGPGRPVAQPVPNQAVIDARKLLGVGPDADARAIRAAHRRLIASVHPDKGGTEALAAQINAARDLLIEEVEQRR